MSSLRKNQPSAKPATKRDSFSDGDSEQVTDASSQTGTFTPRSRGKGIRKTKDNEANSNRPEAHVPKAAEQALKIPEDSGFRPARTAEPLDGDRIAAIKSIKKKEGKQGGHGPLGEYDIDPEHKDRASVPRNPKDARPDQQ